MNLKIPHQFSQKWVPRGKLPVAPFATYKSGAPLLRILPNYFGNHFAAEGIFKLLNSRNFQNTKDLSADKFLVF